VPARRSCACPAPHRSTLKARYTPNRRGHDREPRPARRESVAASDFGSTGVVLGAGAFFSSRRSPHRRPNRARHHLRLPRGHRRSLTPRLRPCSSGASQPGFAATGTAPTRSPAPRAAWKSSPPRDGRRCPSMSARNGNRSTSLRSSIAARCSPTTVQANRGGPDSHMAGRVPEEKAPRGPPLIQLPGSPVIPYTRVGGAGHPQRARARRASPPGQGLRPAPLGTLALLARTWQQSSDVGAGRTSLSRGRGCSTPASSRQRVL
jgi:hypothetical protein